MFAVFLVFALVLAIVVGSYWVFILRPEQREERDVRARLTVAPQRRMIRASLVKSRERLSTIAPLEAVLARGSNLVAPLGALIHRSGIRTTVGTIVLASLLIGVVTAVIVGTVTLSAIAGLIVGALFGCVPFLYVRRAASQRLLKFEEQFPEAIDLMARSLRAGHALPTALKLVSEEVEEPVRGEFRLLFDQQNFGMSLPEALKAFGERVPLLDARFFVTTVLTQREMGGNLSEVLDKLSAVIRERFKVKRHVRAVSAHGRMTGWVLGCMPPAIAAILFVIAPEHIGMLTSDPLGVNLVIAAIVMQTIGVLIIRRIVDVEF